MKGKSNENESELNGVLNPVPPLSVVTGNLLKTSVFPSPGTISSLNFINLPRGRRLVPLQARLWEKSFNAGYDPGLDATAVEVPFSSAGDVSLILVLPGKISDFQSGGLQKLERSLNVDSWERLLKSFMSRNLKLTVPEFRMNSILDLSASLKSLGLRDAFSEKADFSGVNGGRDLHLSSFIQANQFIFGNPQELQKENETSREARINIRPVNRVTKKRLKRRKSAMMLKKLRTKRSARRKKQVLEGRNARIDKVISMLTRQNRQDVTYKLDFERQFLYIVRHNPTGLILYIGRYSQPESHNDHHHHESGV